MLGSRSLYGSCLGAALLVGLAACKGDDGPDCVPEVREYSIGGPITVAGAAAPFAYATLVQRITDYDNVGDCGLGESRTEISFRNLTNVPVRFSWRLSVQINATFWTASGTTTLTESLTTSTEPVLVSRNPARIDLAQAAVLQVLALELLPLQNH